VDLAETDYNDLKKNWLEINVRLPKRDRVNWRGGGRG